MTALRITATDASTVITGAANVHRFDAPSSREIAGTVRATLGPDPAGAEVHIAADERRLRELADLLAGYDIALTTETLGPEPDPVPPTDSFPAVSAAAPEPRRGTWVLVAVVAVVAVVCAVVIVRLVGGRGGGEPDAPVAAPSVPESVPESVPVSTSGAPEVTSIREQPPATVRLERDGLSVELPAGFALEADDGTWRATGEDPDFRLHIAVERLYALPARTMAEQLLADIEADPEVELVDTDGVAVTYLERVGDGSQSLWRTWPEGANQLFVGCHSRREPTTVQRATCRMAMESAQFKGAGVGP